MKNIMTVIVILSTLISCRIDEPTDEPTEAYYNFRNNDFDKLLNIELNSTVKYKNQFGDEIIYTANEVTDNYKDLLSQGNWVTSSIIKYFYYDRKVIELISNYKIRYNFYRFPIDVEQAKENNFTEYPSKFNGSVYVYLWNGIGDDGTININYENSVNEMMINGINYENTIVLQSNNPDPITPERNVNVVYYDLYTGIVGFDDLNNNQWRLTN